MGYFKLRRIIEEPEEESSAVIDVRKIRDNKIIKRLELIAELNLSGPIISEKELDGTDYISIVYDSFVSSEILASQIKYLESKNIPQGILNMRYLEDICRTNVVNKSFKNPIKRVLINLSGGDLKVTLNFYPLQNFDDPKKE